METYGITINLIFYSYTHSTCILYIYLVIHNILQGDAKLIVQIVEEVLLVHEGHSADLVHGGLGRGPHVLEVGRDRDGELPAELLAPEPRHRHVLALGQLNRG